MPAKVGGRAGSSYSFHSLPSLVCWLLKFPCCQFQLLLAGVQRVDDDFLETMMFMIFYRLVSPIQKDKDIWGQDMELQVFNIIRIKVVTFF